MNSQMPQNFFGRETELAKIQKQWEAIVSGKPEAKSVSNILVITGSTGEGKTRLVQRFYETLANDPAWNPTEKAYWPTKFQEDERYLRANPDMEDHQPAGPPRFIWLGMRWQNPEARNLEERLCPIPEIRKELRLHNDQIKKNQTLWEKVKHSAMPEIFGGIKDGTFEKVIEYLPINGFALKAIGSFGKIVYEINQINKSRKDKVEKVKAGDIEALIDDLEQYFSFNPPIPLLLFLDDAQWIDGSTLEFLEEFSKKARREKLPVFIIITHWIGEWNELKEKKDGANLYVICKSIQAQVMDLSVVDEELLRKYLLGKLPGLTFEQQQILVDKSCNNFLSLEENIGYLLDTPENFVGEDITKPLSEIGENEINSLENDRTKRIRSQFNKLEKDAKRVLGWSSHIGVKFLSDVIEKVAKEESISSNLKVTFKRVEQRAYISSINTFFKEFRDRAIYKLAQNYFKTYDIKMESIIDNAIKNSSVFLVSDSFNDKGSVKHVDCIGFFYDSVGVMDIESEERRDILGMMMKVYGLPNKEVHDPDEYALRIRIIVLDILNDYDSDLLESTTKKAQSLKGIDWEYLPENAIGWDQKISLSEILRNCNASDVAFEMISFMDRNKKFNPDFLEQQTSLESSLFSRIMKYSMVKAGILEDIGRGIDALNELENAINKIEKSPEFNRSRLQALRYYQMAKAIYDNDMWYEGKVDCEGYLKKAAFMLKESNNIEFEENVALVIIECLMKAFRAEMRDGCALMAESFVLASREAKSLFSKTQKAKHLYVLADIYSQGAIVFADNLKWKAFQKCIKRFNRVSKILKKDYPNKFENKLKSLRKHLNYWTNVQGRMLSGSYEELEEQYVREKQFYQENSTLENLLDFGRSAYALGQAFRSIGEFDRAIQHFFESYSADSEYFLKRQEFNIFLNLIQVTRFLLECDGIESKDFTKNLLDDVIPKMDVVFEQLMKAKTNLMTNNSIFSIGKSFFKIKEYKKANYFFIKSAKLFQIMENRLPFPLVMSSAIKALGFLGASEIYLGNIDQGLAIYKDIYDQVMASSSLEETKLDVLFSIQGLFLICFEECEINYRSLEIRKGVLEYWQYRFDTDKSIENWENLILSKLSLTKALNDNQVEMHQILLSAKSEIAKLQKEFPEYDCSTMLDGLALAENNWERR